MGAKCQEEHIGKAKENLKNLRTKQTRAIWECPPQAADECTSKRRLGNQALKTTNKEHVTPEDEGQLRAECPKLTTISNQV